MQGLKNNGWFHHSLHDNSGTTSPDKYKFDQVGELN